jgi:hypothetical protein
MEAKLVVNDVEVKLSYDELDSISGCLSDDAKRSEILYELSKSPSSMVRITVVYNNAIDEKTVERLIRDSSIEVLRGIVRNSLAQRIITEEDMERLIATRDTELLCHIAEQIDDFDACDLDRLCEKLVAQKDPQIRHKLASNPATPARFLEELVDDEDLDVARAAGNAMEDLDDQEDEDD